MTNLTTIMGGSAIIAGIVALWDKIRFILSYIWGLVFIKVNIQESALHQAVSIYCKENYRSFFIQPFVFSCSKYFVKPEKKSMYVAFQEVAANESTYFKGIYPIVVSEGKSNNGDNSRNQYFVSFIRGTFDIKKVISESMKLFNDRIYGSSSQKIKSDRFYVKKYMGTSKKRSEGKGIDSNVEPAVPTTSQDYNLVFLGDKIFLDWKKEDLICDNTKDKKLKMLAYPREIEELIEEIDRWANSGEWYEEKGISWKRGYGLYGKPGTGKTALVQAIGQKFDLPIMSFDLSTMNNSEFYYYWNDMISRSPCIALFEDIDSVFNGRENINKNANGDYLSFDCFLNCISGVENVNGVLLFITTNHIDSLDEALGKPRTDKHVNGTYISTRPGRIDRVFELPLLDKDCRIKIASRILSDFPDSIEKLVNDGEGDTGAQFQERCGQVALKKYWESKKCEK